MSKKRHPSQITDLVIHCSATPNGQHITAEDIDAWHKQKKFNRNPGLFPYHRPDLKHIGYHYVIRANGAVECGRHEHETGAHALDPKYPKGDGRRYRYNNQGIAICLIGTDRFSPEQFNSLSVLVKAIQERYPNINVLGHRELSVDKNQNNKIDPAEFIKQCPGFDVPHWLEGGSPNAPGNGDTSAIPGGRSQNTPNNGDTSAIPGGRMRPSIDHLTQAPDQPIEEH